MCITVYYGIACYGIQYKVLTDFDSDLIQLRKKRKVVNLVSIRSIQDKINYNYVREYDALLNFLNSRFK